MFENLLNRKTFDTEKELILYVIENCDKSYSKIYNKYAKREWKSNPKYHSPSGSSPEYTYDSWIMEWFSNNSDDQEIIEALWEKYKYGNTCWTRPIFEIPFVKNVNLTDDLIKSVYSQYSRNEDTLKWIQMVEYKYITEETKAKITAIIVELKEKKRKEKEDRTKKMRKEKEDRTKQKLTAFLTTAAATKSVLTGNSIDDVVEQTITSDVDDAVLDYMNKLFDK